MTSCHYISGAGTFELQVVAPDLDSFSLGGVKAGGALPPGHLKAYDLHCGEPVYGPWDIHGTRLPIVGIYGHILSLKVSSHPQQVLSPNMTRLRNVQAASQMDRFNGRYGTCQLRSVPIRHTLFFCARRAADQAGSGAGCGQHQRQ